MHESQSARDRRGLLDGNTMSPRAFKNAVRVSPDSSLGWVDLGMNKGHWGYPSAFGLDMTLFLPCFYFPALRELNICFPDRTFNFNEAYGNAVEIPWDGDPNFDFPLPNTVQLFTLRLHKTLIKPKILTTILLHTSRI